MFSTPPPPLPPAAHPSTGLDFSEIVFLNLALRLVGLIWANWPKTVRKLHGMEGQANYFLDSGMRVSPYFEKPPCSMNFS